MTFEQRIAELGADLSDLPTRYEVEHRSVAFEAADNFGGSLSMTHNFTDYIMHLTDIIDRMETRIVNLTGERDWLLSIDGKDCPYCANHLQNEPLKCGKYEDYEDVPEACFEYSGVPEDWRADDD